MPPKAKFTRNDITAAALKIIQQDGLEKLTARNLAEALHVSTKPIFVAFRNMDEVILECRNEVTKLYDNYDPEIENSDFYSAEKYVHFAGDEPNLFKFRYLQDNNSAGNFEELMKKLDSNFESSIKSIQMLADCSEENGKRLYKDVWLFAHGIACLCAFRQCTFSSQEIHEEIRAQAYGISKIL